MVKSNTVIQGDNQQNIRANSAGAIINNEGYIIHSSVTIRRMANLGSREMGEIHGIVIHQTGGKTLQSALDAAAHSSGIGAHFYIDKDGTIIQAASIDRVCGHVGLLKPRCLAEHRCRPDEAKRLNLLKAHDISKIENTKNFPDRYPSNRDSIGIELVGYYQKVPGQTDPVYETVTDSQQKSLKWLIAIICNYRAVNTTEIYRHPTVSWKAPTEAATAKW